MRNSTEPSEKIAGTRYESSTPEAIAAARCGGLLANVGAMTKSTRCGHAAMLGLEAATLAVRGLTGNANVFETHQGYGAAS